MEEIRQLAVELEKKSRLEAYVCICMLNLCSMS